ncbi:long-chain-fatty acid--ACP ligase MbtM [Gordonia sp. ABSL49_1]|uniref:long-chain-fatty acid--ACP ligase MbtM n=1 Tax=Gordonia sp. ABSL49_1 TaxID=2920941 RepID=UPI001F0EFAF6|nr:long-chain-fatty acid--ACP ligase MbtM [Gordonia sp. ABSL49_1]MCH5641607.1 long-chain-fatty acid--ACP ligase MbtM [Gordonia sp. ABSL49_1]
MVTALDEAGTASILAESVSEGMLSGNGSLSVLDPETGTWDTRPWSDVHARAEEVAAQILADRQRVEPHHVGLIGDPSFDLVAAVLGAWLAGVAVSILPGPIRGADEERWAQTTYARFADIGVGTVLGSGPQLDLLAKVDGWMCVEQVAVYGAGIDTTGFEPRRVGEDAPAVLQGTAGSTGDPKTAVLSTKAVHTNTTELIVRLGVHRTRDIGFSWLPLYHDMGLTFLLATMGAGFPLWLVPNSAFAAAPFKWLEWLTESRATLTAAPNFAYDILGKYGSLIKDADLSALRVSISGGEPIDPDAFDKFLEVTERFGFDPGAAAPSYGMAESTCAVTIPSVGSGANYDEVTVTPPGDGSVPIRRRYAILGKPLGGMQLRIVEPADGEIPQIDDRAVGHVEIRGTSMMNGYLGHPPLAAGEWFPTGDIGYLVDGKLVICGRAKEIVIVAGRNLFPIEIERAAAKVSGVRSGCVVAMARNEQSARPGLVIVAEFRGEDEESAKSAVKAEVAAQCGVMPSDVIFVAPGSVPRTTSGKIRRLETKRLVEVGEMK